MKAIKSALNLGSAKPAATEPTADQLVKLKETYAKAGQDQVFAFYDDLSGPDKASLFQQLAGFDPARINDIAHRALNQADTHADDTPARPGLEPLPASATASILDSDPQDIDNWYRAGLDLIARNKVAVVLMAGGQGTRLGSSAPKGCYDIGLPSRKSLFRIQAERIRKVQELAANRAGTGTGTGTVVVPWYVMTSGPTRAPTEQYLQENDYFGLDKANVVVFEQGVLPCLSNDGKILLESRGRVAVAPDGNGGIYQALVVSDVMGDMRRRGIEHVHAYCVDNCLVKVADPVFVGFAAAKDVDVATKVVRKRDATEPVGLILLRDGRPAVVEYSEIDKDTAEARDDAVGHADGGGGGPLLKFRAANIVNHYYSFRFLESIPLWAHKLPHHIARKKIAHVDVGSGEPVKPDKPNGIKLEQFVFDVFPMLGLDKFACMEVKRDDEFSPLKNARGTGEDDPDTSKSDIMLQGRRWLETAGATVTGEGGVEVSPLFSYAGEGLEKLSGKEVKAPAVLEME